MTILSGAFAGKRYAVLGLARSGLATVDCLSKSGAHVTAWDTREEARAAVADKAVLADPLTIDLAGFDGVVVSPGVPLNRHPITEYAANAGVPIIGDIELFALARPTLPPHKVVGITGTNGKSTTTALIHHILETAGIPTRMGGNIGLPILGQEPLEPGINGVGVYVLELSSYQIDLTHSLACDVAVLLNITPDHLDRYDGFAGYVASKARLFDMQTPGQLRIIALDDANTRAIAAQNEDKAGDGEVEHDEIGVYAADVGADEQARWPALQGPHNAQNVAAARAVLRALGISEDVIERGLASYAALPHRMQRVAERDGVLYVNDSKATNAASTAPALGAWPATANGPRIHWIAGGLPKSDTLDECVPYYPNIKAAYTIGEAGPLFAQLLAPYVPVENSEMLITAVRQAAQAARPGDVVLFSPACASFDQFRDYEARGDAFVAAVRALDDAGQGI